MRVLETLAKLCAVLAGMLLVLITLMTCASVSGREFIGKTITGDFELSGAAAGAAIALFMPWCQARRGHIIVDFFTTRASAATQLRLDRLGALLLALVMALMTWRTTLGGINAWTTQSSTTHDGLSGVGDLQRNGASAGADRADRAGAGRARLRGRRA